MQEISVTIDEIFIWVVWIAIFCLLFGLLIILFRVMYGMVYQLRRELVILELIPHATNDKKPDATNQLFKSLHGLANISRWYEKVLGKKESYSLKIVATKSDGIRYIITCDKKNAESLKHVITSYAPDVVINESTDFAKKVEAGKILEFKQKSHFAYPLNSNEELSSHDPVGYITNAMSKLEPKETMAVQYVIRPIVSRKAEIINHRIMTNENLMPQLRRFNLPIINWFASIISTILFGISDTVSDIAHNGSTQTSVKSASKDYEYKRQVARGIKPARTLTYFEHEMVESISQKLGQQLFAVDIRVLIATNNKSRYHSRKKNIISAFNVYSVPKYQSITLKTFTHFLIPKRFTYAAFEKRLSSPLPSSKSILSISEVASLFHFTNSMGAKTENVVKSLSKALPAPISLKRGNELDVVIGQNIYHGVATDIGLTKAERERHMYIIGGTGNGKTTMLQYQIIQDMQNGKGVAVLDPHGDMAETLLRHIPENRINDVVYFNPDDLEHPFALNLLELTPGLTGNNLLREKDIITESVISVFRKIFSDDDSGGHRIEYVLRNAIHTALTVENATLFTVLKLLQNATYRRDITNKLTDEDLKDFWKNELGKAGDMQKVKMSAGITAKIGRFNVNASTKAILGEYKSTINFEDIMDNEKILICNLSKGMLGEDVSELFGITILAKLQLASLRRARIKQYQRKPYYLYVDEFQNFATPSFIQMLSEARKYRLFLTMAEQSTSQHDDQQMVSVILANVGTVICFRTGNPNDEKLILPLFMPYIEQGEIANLNAYNFYARLSSVIAQEPLSGVTLLLDSEGSDEIAIQVIESSRIKYAQKPKPAVDIKQEHKAESKPRKTNRKTPKKESSPQPAVKMLGHQESI
jgi:hypothetical protein